MAVFSRQELTLILNSLCPEVSEFALNEFNPINNWNQSADQLPITLCEYGKLTQYAVIGAKRSARISCAIAVLGQMTCCASLIVLNAEPFNQPTFYYHKFINFADLIYLTILLINSLRTAAPTGFANSPFLCHFGALFGAQLDNAFPDFIGTVVIWISVQRTLTYFPYAFSLIHRRNVAVSICVSLLIVSICLNIPTAFTDRCVISAGNRSYFVDADQDYQLSDFYLNYVTIMTYFAAIRSGLIVVGTGGTVIVLCKINKRKLRLADIVGRQSITSQQLAQQASVGRMCCLLQLCEALPLIATSCMTMMAHGIHIFFGINTFASLSYDQASKLLEESRYRLNVLFVKQTFSDFTHVTHFLFYLLFIPNIRRTTRNVLKLWWMKLCKNIN